MKKNWAIKFLSLLCLAVMVMACSNKETTTVFKTVVYNRGFHVELERTCHAKGDRVISMLQLGKMDFTKSENTREDYVTSKYFKDTLEFMVNSPAIKRYDIVDIDEEKLIEEIEIEFTEDNLEALAEVGIVKKQDGKVPKYASLKHMKKALLAEGYEEVRVDTK